MQRDSEQSTSVWMATAQVPEQTTLAIDTHAEVCVIGAGIAGLTTAYLLAKEGKTVVVIDDGKIGGGQTQRTTAHLSNAIDDRYVEIERMHGQDGARLAAESHTAAIERIEKIVREEKIDCDFERLEGYLFAHPDEAPEFLDQELEAAQRAGLTGVEKLARAPLDCFDTGPCLRFPRQGQFHPLKYLAGLARAIQRLGGRVFTGVHAESIEGGPPAEIETTGGHVVSADAVFVATNTPVNDLVAIHTKQAAYLSFVVGARVPRDSVPHVLLWDTLDPYHYVRVQRITDKLSAGSGAYDFLIVGGEDEKTGQIDDPEERYKRLEAWARERFPMIEGVEFRWSGQVMEPVDGLAFIGRNPLDVPNVFIATGDSGMGMTHGTIAGILLTDLVLERENAWAKLYDPSRKTLSAAGEFAKENLNVAKQYTDWLTGGDVSSVDEIVRDSGAVIRHGLTKVAAYRDEAGELHQCSAVCPHLGCIVAWNRDEKTWDCPCHGSRFNAHGHVINGPANTNLAPIEEEAAAPVGGRQAAKG